MFCQGSMACIEKICYIFCQSTMVCIEKTYMFCQNTTPTLRLMLYVLSEYYPNFETYVVCFVRVLPQLWDPVHVAGKHPHSEEEFSGATLTLFYSRGPAGVSHMIIKMAV